jgi:hypothetical protein
MFFNQQPLESVWVTRIVERGQSVVNHPFVASLLTLGWIPVVTTATVFFLGTPERLFVIAQSLTASIVVIGPYQAYLYDTSVLPSFFEEVTELVPNEKHDQLAELQDQYEQKFRTDHTWFVFLWTAAVVAVLPLNAEYFVAQGIQHLGPAYVAYLVFLIDFGLLSGLGLYSILVTTRCIGDVAELGLEIEPLHPDGLGGLSVIGNFAVWTTFLISNGALAIPLSLDMVTTRAGGAVVYFGVGAYVLLIAVSFVYPTAKINRKAQDLREEHLEEYRSKIRRLESELAAIETEDKVDRKEIGLRMEIERARKEFQNYRNVRLYPLSIGILTRLASSVLLPIAITVVEFFVSSALAG